MIYLARFYILYAWSVFIFMMLTFATPPYEGTVISWHDKIFHILLFGVFAYLFVYFLVLFKRLKLSAILLISAGSALGYSLFGEYIQGFVPGRTVSIYDFYAGAAGVILAIIISYAKYRKPKKI